MCRLYQSPSDETINRGPHTLAHIITHTHTRTHARTHARTSSTGTAAVEWAVPKSQQRETTAHSQHIIITEAIPRRGRRRSVVLRKREFSQGLYRTCAVFHFRVGSVRGECSRRSKPSRVEQVFRAPSQRTKGAYCARLTSYA